MNKLIDKFTSLKFDSGKLHYREKKERKEEETDRNHSIKRDRVKNQSLKRVRRSG